MARARNIHIDPLCSCLEERCHYVFTPAERIRYRAPPVDGNLREAGFPQPDSGGDSAASRIGRGMEGIHGRSRRTGNLCVVPGKD